MRYSILLLILINILSCKKVKVVEATNIEGLAFGTSYHITYYESDNENYSDAIDGLFYDVNKSLSTYIPNSAISKINNGDTTIVVDDYFKEVFEKSLHIYHNTNGAFDPTIGILVNAWGFGPEKGLANLDSLKVKQLLELVDFGNITLENDKIVKTDPRIYFDFNAIAKGYAVDIAGRFLESKGIDNYLVEIGGELRSRGVNKTKNKPWKVGIENPNYDGTRSIEKTVELNNETMATSGNYRKFKIDSISGMRYAHIINSKTGYPAKNELLSVSVIANLDCADVDAYATALMTMSLEKAQRFFITQPQLKVFIIYSDGNGEIQTYKTLNF